MWAFQRDILKRPHLGGPEFNAPWPWQYRAVHAPVCLPHRRTDMHCGEGRTHSACGVCGTPMQIVRFGPAHNAE